MGNQYYKTNHDAYNVVSSQFYDYLQREGVTVKDYWTGEEYLCFFRRNKDTNQTNDNISLYYPVGVGIHEGTTITYGDTPYVILNQESLENHIYHRSDGIRADVMLNTYSDGMELNIPTFAYDLTSAQPTANNVISLVSGNSELMTGDNEWSRQLTLDSQFTAMGGVFKIVNLNYKSGIARISTSRVAGSVTPIEYSIKINSESKYSVGSAVKIDVTASRTEGTVKNPTLKWSVSDPAIATVNSDGTILFVNEGTVAISCLWVEHGCTDTITVEVVDPSVNYVCAISGRDTLKESTYRVYTATFYNSDGTVNDDIVPVWSLTVPEAISGKVKISEADGNTVKVTAESGTNGYIVTLHLTDTDGLYAASKEIEITGIF